MAVRIMLGLVALACLIGLVIEQPKHRASEASRLEKACWVKRIYVPCFLLDEYGRTEWRI